MLIHEVEHGHIEHFIAPHVWLMLLVYLHVGNGIRIYLHFRRVWRAPEGGTEQLGYEGRLTQQATQLGKA